MYVKFVNLIYVQLYITNIVAYMYMQVNVLSIVLPMRMFEHLPGVVFEFL